MLKILDEKVQRTEESIKQEFGSCMFILTNYTSLQNPKGFLYCVSFDRDSYRDICKTADDLEKKNVPCILGGSYKDAVGF